jgi:peptidoglycan/xylan/chitin deacetylase (PgdA/CDA1 family)
VLEFHGVAAKRYDGVPLAAQPHLTTDDLREILKWVGNRYAFLTPDAFFNTGQRGVLLTFDDGFANNYTQVLPVLKALNAPAIFFVASQHIIDSRDWLWFVREQVNTHWGGDVPDEVAQYYYDGMTEKQLQACVESGLVTVGGHTMHHPYLTQCEDEELLAELADNKRHLEEVTGKPVDYFAYPLGDYDQRVISAVKKVGYKAAFVEDSQGYGESVFELHRVGIYSAKWRYLFAKLSGFHRPPHGQFT